MLDILLIHKRKLEELIKNNADYKDIKAESKMIDKIIEERLYSIEKSH